MTWFLHNLRHPSSKLFPEIIDYIPSCWFSSSYLPITTFFQVLIAVILISKDIEDPKTARIFRFVGVSTLLLLSDIKFACLRFETSQIIEDVKRYLPVSHDRHSPNYWEQADFDYDDEHYNDCYLFEDDDEDQDDEG